MPPAFTARGPSDIRTASELTWAIKRGSMV